MASVYSVIVVIVYASTFHRFLLRFPSWYLFSPMGDVVNIYFYVVTFNFVESLLMLAGVLMLSIIFPRTWYFEKFISRGIFFVVMTLGLFIYVDGLTKPDLIFPWALIRQFPWFIASIALIVPLIDRIDLIQRVLLDISDRMIVFLYITIPVSVIALSVVIIRNVF